MDRLTVAAAGREWLAKQLRDAGFKVVMPTSSKTNISVAPDKGKIEFQIIASSDPSFRVRRSMMEKPESLIVYVWNVADPEKCVGYGMTPKEALAFVEQEGYTQRRNWTAYRETGTIMVNEKVQDWLEQHRLTPEILSKKIQDASDLKARTATQRQMRDERS